MPPAVFLANEPDVLNHGVLRQWSMKDSSKRTKSRSESPPETCLNASPRTLRSRRIMYDNRSLHIKIFTLIIKSIRIVIAIAIAHGKTHGRIPTFKFWLTALPGQKFLPGI